MSDGMARQLVILLTSSLLCGFLLLVRFTLPLNLVLLYYFKIRLASASLAMTNLLHFNHCDTLADTFRLFFSGWSDCSNLRMSVAPSEFLLIGASLLKWSCILKPTIILTEVIMLTKVTRLTEIINWGKPDNLSKHDDLSKDNSLLQHALYSLQ